MDKAIVKFNNGRGALLCNGCNVIVSYGADHRTDIEHYCEECYHKNNMYTIADIDFWEKDAMLRVGDKEYYFQFNEAPTLEEAIQFFLNETPK